REEERGKGRKKKGRKKKKRKKKKEEEEEEEEEEKEKKMRKSVAPSLDLSQAIRYIFTRLSMTRHIWRRACGVVHLQQGQAQPRRLVVVTTFHRPFVFSDVHTTPSRYMYKQAVSGL